MPPFSPSAYGVFPNSRKLFWPAKPCQPSVSTHGGSMRPVESGVEQVVFPVESVLQTAGGSLEPGPSAIDFPEQSADAQYTAPGTRKAVGTEIVSAVLAMKCPILEFPQGGLCVLAAAPHGVPSAGPPASYTTWVPVFL